MRESAQSSAQFDYLSRVEGAAPPSHLGSKGGTLRQLTSRPAFCWQARLSVGKKAPVSSGATRRSDSISKGVRSGASVSIRGGEWGRLFEVKQDTAPRAPAHVHEGREGSSSPSPDRPAIRHRGAESHAHLFADSGAGVRTRRSCPWAAGPAERSRDDLHLVENCHVLGGVEGPVDGASVPVDSTRNTQPSVTRD